MLRRLALLSAVTLTSFVAPASHSAASAQVAVHKFIGAWTPDKGSGTLLAGHPFSIQAEDSDTTLQEIGPANQENFAKNCDPKVATDITYFVISYTWKPGPAPMGGCYSSVTAPHVEFWGRQSEYGELRQEIVDGEAVLTGEWDIYDDQLVVHKHTFTAHHPAALFRASAKRRVPVKHSGDVYRETELAGVGTARLEFRPTANCKPEQIVDGDGSLSLSITKVGGPAVIDFYDVRFTVLAPTSEAYRQCSDGDAVLARIPIRVTKSDPDEKEPCPVGAEGHVHLVDPGTSAATEGFVMKVPKCGIDLTLKHGPSDPAGDKVQVAIDVNENGY